MIAGVFWLLFFCVDVLKKNALEHETHYFYAFYVFGFVLWFLLTFPLYNLFRWSKRHSTLVRLLILLLSGPLIGILKTILSWISFYIVLKLLYTIDTPLMPFILKQSTFFYVEATIIAWVVLILFFLSEIYLGLKDKSLEAATLESELFQAKLQALKSQIQPHFLFNTHNTIAMLIRTKQYQQAIEMTTQLSDLLRSTLDNEDDHFVTLEKEVELINKYLAIEQIRFEDVLETEINIVPECEQALVPNMILQPLVENAIKHGISKHLGASLISIQCSKEEQYLIIRLSNTGPGLPSDFDPTSQKGIGLQNVWNRLTQYYGNDVVWRFENIHNGVNCQLKIPLRYE